MRQAIPYRKNFTIHNFGIFSCILTVSHVCKYVSMLVPYNEARRRTRSSMAIQWDLVSGLEEAARPRADTKNQQLPGGKLQVFVHR